MNDQVRGIFRRQNSPIHVDGMTPDDIVLELVYDQHRYAIRVYSPKDDTPPQLVIRCLQATKEAHFPSSQYVFEEPLDEDIKNDLKECGWMFADKSVYVACAMYPLV